MSWENLKRERNEISLKSLISSHFVSFIYKKNHSLKTNNNKKDILWKFISFYSHLSMYTWSVFHAKRKSSFEQTERFSSFNWCWMSSSSSTFFSSTITFKGPSQYEEEWTPKTSEKAFHVFVVVVGVFKIETQFPNFDFFTYGKFQFFNDCSYLLLNSLAYHGW